jgi:hypothetical protein
MISDSTKQLWTIFRVQQEIRVDITSTVIFSGQHISSNVPTLPHAQGLIQD